MQQWKHHIVFIYFVVTIKMIFFFEKRENLTLKLDFKYINYEFYERENF